MAAARFAAVLITHKGQTCRIVSGLTASFVLCNLKSSFTFLPQAIKMMIQAVLTSRSGSMQYAVDLTPKLNNLRLKGVQAMANQVTDQIIHATLAAFLIVSTVLVMSVVAFAASPLKAKQLPTDQTLKSSAGNEKFNTVRFETFGGQPDERVIGYFLYKDGVSVSFNGPQLETIGKLSLNEVFADHDRVVKAKFYSRASKLIIREIIRENAVVGYAVSDLGMEIALWDLTKDPSNISLELRYKDLRAKGERYYGGPK